ncbi:hypothetical protein LPJ81_001414 [Coemansia sp. IMI 209127]|nr:hypothetical protein LPJ81_001414 [Coemansia sp. IMI 209127]
MPMGKGASHNEWVRLLEEFFEKAELHQCRRTLGIETTTYPSIPSDTMLKDHLLHLANGIQSLAEGHAKQEPSDEVQDQSTNAKAVQDIAQSVASKEETVRRMDAFIEAQRKEIDSNNQQEFLVSDEGRETTCARTDANGSSQGVKIQLDVAQGSSALERSVASHKGSATRKEAQQDRLLGGLEERVENICEHLNVRFTPATVDIYSRVSALEDRIIILESEFPPWSAEHFYQPGRKYLQAPPITLYRVLPASSDAVKLPDKIPRSSSAELNGRSIAVAGDQVANPTAKAQAAASASRPGSSSIRKRRKTGAQINSPLDKRGKPMFHACGRGVDSSLTRAVLAQLQARQQTSQQQPHSSVDDGS